MTTDEARAEAERRYSPALWPGNFHLGEWEDAFVAGAEWSEERSRERIAQLEAAVIAWNSAHSALWDYYDNGPDSPEALSKVAGPMRESENELRRLAEELTMDASGRALQPSPPVEAEGEAK